MLISHMIYTSAADIAFIYLFISKTGIANTTYCLKNRQIDLSHDVSKVTCNFTILTDTVFFVKYTFLSIW